MPVLARNDFFEQLEKEVEHQTLLEQRKILPSQLGWLGRIVARYSWQILLLLAVISAGLKIGWGQL